MPARRMLSSAKRLGARLAALCLKSLSAVDTALVALGGAFGTRAVDGRLRYGVFLAVYVAIYAVAMLHVPVLPLLALAIGYVGVLAVGRAWVRNERHRAAIVKKLIDDDPDALPDLRGLALLSALQLVLLFPLIFWHAQRSFYLYDVGGASFWMWVPFTFDSFCKSMFDWSEVYEIHFTDVAHASAWGRHLVLLKRLTVDFMLIQGVIRIISIRTTIREAVDAVARDPDLAVRVGQRAIPHLIEKLEDDDAATRDSAAIALGRLQDNRAMEPLIGALAGDNSAQAAMALGKLAHARAVPPLVEKLSDASVWVRKCAAEALGQVGDEQAARPLETLREQDENEHVRKAAAEALDKVQPPAEVRRAG